MNAISITLRYDIYVDCSKYVDNIWIKYTMFGCKIPNVITHE